MSLDLDARPIVVAIAGPNGAGKTSFYQAHLARAALRYVNADDIARDQGLESREAAEVAGTLRRALLEMRESFIFETVFSDPVGDKVDFLRAAAAQGYTVVLIFIGVADVAMSEDRVTMRVLQGGHDVPSDRIAARYPRTMANLRRAIASLPHVIVYDNSDLARGFEKIAEYEAGKAVWTGKTLPSWFTA